MLLHHKLKSLSLGIALFAVVCMGCGAGVKIAPVRGRITINGRPVTEGQITFYPVAGNMAYGSIGADGEYRLTTFDNGDGALVGKHQVVILATKITGPPSPATLEEELRIGGGGGTLPADSGGLEWIVPEKYSDRSQTPLTAEVKPGSNTIDFSLDE